MAWSKAKRREWMRESRERQRAAEGRTVKGAWSKLVEKYLGIPRKRKYWHIAQIEWKLRHKRGPKPRAPIPIDRATALRCVLSPLRLKRWHAAEKVRMYEANPKRGLHTEKSVDSE